MKKSKKKELKFKNKVKGFRLGDNVWVNIRLEKICSVMYGILEEIGKDYIVIDKYLINDYELINLNKI